MENILKKSYCYKMISMFLKWMKNLFANSCLIGLFLERKDTQQRDENFLFARLVKWVIKGLQKIAKMIKLDVIFDHSILANPMIWLSITVFLMPFLPTMVDLILLAFTAGSLLLKIMITPDFKYQYFKINNWILFFILVVYLSAITSISKAESKNIALLISAFAFSFFLMIHIVENKKQLKFLLYLMVIASVLTALIGISQYLKGDIYSQDWIDDEMFEDIKMRVYSTFENPNVYGEYLILVIPIIVALFFEKKGFWKKIFLFACFGITLAALILTFSRGCWLGMMLALVLLLIVIDKRFIWLGILGLVLLPFILPETITNRFLSIGNMEDSSTTYRVYIWMGTINMLKDYWFSGIGLGITSFNTVYPIYSFDSIWAPHSHNLYLQLIVEYGIIGLIIFLGMIYYFYKEIAMSVVKRKNMIASGIACGMTGYLLQSFFDNTWYNYRVVLIFWMVIALGMVASRKDFR